MGDSIYYIGISQSLFVSFVLLTKNNKQGSDWVLFAWLLTIATKLVLVLLDENFTDFVSNSFPSVLISLTFGPYLFIYTKYLIYRKFFFRSKDYIHFIPFLFFFISYFIFFNGDLALEGHLLLEKDGYMFIRFLYSGATIISVIYYTLATLYLLRRYRKNLTDRFSYFSSANELNWVYFLTFLFATTYLTLLVLNVYNLKLNEAYFNTGFVSDISISVLAFSVSFFGLKQPYLFKVIKDKKRLKKEEIDEVVAEEIEEEVKEKYKQSTLSEAVKKDYIEKLLEHMKVERPHLNSELTVQDLSKQLNIPRHHLTEVLNVDLEKNFFNFINEYRVEEVKKRLIDKKHEHLTIVAIAFDSGFNSKSTFNSIFKQFTDMTPSKWRNAQLKKLQQK